MNPFGSNVTPVVRFNFLIPTVRSDEAQTPVPKHETAIVKRELRELFLGFSWTGGAGVWRGQKAERHVHYYRDFPRSPRKDLRTIIQFFQAYKSNLRARFMQEEIYMWIQDGIYLVHELLPRKIS